MHERSNPDRDLDALLARAPRVRALARGLCSDAAAQEDLTQEALLVALQRPGGEAAPLAWFRRVIERLSVDRARSEGARRRREQRAARAEAQPSTLDMLARADLQRRLVEEVLALAEPYRSTLLERWFEERSPEEIARRLGVPASTVRTRLARGHALLRERLERREGKNWMSALAALGAAHAGAPAATTTLATGGMLVATGTKLTLLAVALALGALWWAWPAHDATPVNGALEARTTSTTTPATEVMRGHELHEPARDEVLVPVQEKQAPAAASPPSELSEEEAEALEVRDGVFEDRKLRGLVIRGREPLESGTAWLAPGNRIAPHDPRQPWGGVLNPVPTPEGTQPRSTPIGSDGRFEFELPNSTYYTLAIDDGSGIVRQHVFNALLRGREHATVVIVLGSATIAGRVFDERGVPCSGALVVVDQSLSRNAMDRHFAALATTDEHGAYVVRHLPAGKFEVGVVREPDPRSVLVDDEVELKLEVGEQAKLDFGRSTPLPVWRGSLLSRSGEPVSGVIVDLTEAASGWQRRVAVVGGRFEFALAPGTYRASTERIARHREDIELALVELGEDGIERDLLLPGTRLRGLLLDAHTHAPPTDLSSQSISARPRGHDYPGAFVSVLLAPDGTFVLDGLWPGEWVISGYRRKVEALGGGEASILVRDGELVAPLTVLLMPR
jgi:RNA polymerase sigma-70 factor (ECF subfamily)